MKIFKKEKEVVDLAMDYLETVQACVQPGKEAVIAYLKGNPLRSAELRPQVANLESKADDLRRTIADKLYSGAYLPLMRGDIYNILEALDRVPNAAESCCVFFTSQKPRIPPELVEPFTKITNDAFDIVEDLMKAERGFFQPSGKIESIRELVRVVGVKESAVDAQEWELTEAIFDMPSLELAQKMHLRQALDRIVRIPDRAEDAAERLSVVAMKSVL